LFFLEAKLEAEGTQSHLAPTCITADGSAEVKGVRGDCAVHTRVIASSLLRRKGWA